MKRIINLIMKAILALLLLIIVAGLIYYLVISYKISKVYDKLGEEASELVVDGIKFRDLNKNGTLDIYEDSRVPLEDRVNEPTSQDFLKKYDLSNASTVRKSLHAILDKEMIYETPGQVKPVYEVYDVFLSRWFHWKSGFL